MRRERNFIFAKRALHFAIYYYICSRYTPIIPHFAVKTYHMRARSSNVTHTHVYAYARVLVRAYAHTRIRYRVNFCFFTMYFDKSCLYIVYVASITTSC